MSVLTSISTQVTTLHRLQLILVIMLMSLTLFAQTNISTEIQVGKFTWSAQNLNVSTFRNGDTIYHASDKNDWIQAGNNRKPAWCYYNNDPANGLKYGKLYNWFAVTDARGLAPEGWHIPDYEEWNTLKEQLCLHSDSSGISLKSVDRWKTNSQSIDPLGFQGLPGGTRTSGNFYLEGQLAAWWTASDTTNEHAWNINVSSIDNEVNKGLLWKGDGLSIRCVKTNNFHSQSEPAMNEQDSNEIGIILGSQIWMAKNLNIETFQNGDTIPQARTNQEWEIAGKNKKPVWCYYNNASENGEKYGKLYNWFAVNDPRGLAPKGWRVATSTDWNRLSQYCGGDKIAGNHLKSNSYWQKSLEGAILNGFNALPAGNRNPDGSFDKIGKFSIWWTASEQDENSAVYRSIGAFDETSLFRFSYNKMAGFSVRCVKN